MSMSLDQEITARALRSALLKAQQTDAELKHAEVFSDQVAGVRLAAFRIREAFRANDSTFDVARFDGLVYHAS